MITLINGYEIRKVDKEEILYIYLDYDMEFASLNRKDKKNLKKDIKKYIKNNRIKFKGSLVAIVAGGLLMGTISLNSRLKGNIYTSNSNKIVAILNDELLTINNDDLISDNIVIKDEETILDKDIINVEVPKKNSNINNIELKEKTINEEVNLPSKDEESKKDIFICINGNNIELEEYVIGVVAAEMPASFNVEALKAQAVLARTYALKSMQDGKKLESNNNTQNYKTNNELKNMWGISYETYYNKIKNAVYETKGLYVTYNNKIIDAVYHSTSNGYTEEAKNVWGNDIPYLKSIESIYDSTNKSFLKSTYYSFQEISDKLGLEINSETSFNIVSRTSSGRVLEVIIKDKSFSGVDFRNILGLRSTDFSIELEEDGVNIITRGYGHGVGMSQYGANGMANNGSNYKDIIYHYYSGVSIKSL